MSRKLRRSAFGALAAGTAAAAFVVPLTGVSGSWTPVTRGLAEQPARMLPATVSAARPVQVVSTVLDADGRPVVTSRTATDRASAERLIRAGQQAPRAVSVELDAPAHAIGVPTGTDTYRGSQWDLARIDAPDAWQTSTGAGVTVAVVDTGVDATHPDLAGQILPGVDLVAGTSGVSTDPNGHGTHVAGTIAAVTGNGVGVAGFAPDARILPVRVLGADGTGSMSAVANGIVWAADHGAQVVNMSLGSSSQVSAVTNAITYARSKGVVVVAAAGNARSSGSPTHYPAADPGVIGVAATDSADRVSSFSNQGAYVDLAAPGSAILSTLPVSMGGYASYSGTSMASPHVAAVAALLRSYDSGLSPDRVQQAIEKSALDLGAAGKDVDFGSGRVDAAAALALVAAPATSPSESPSSPAPTTEPTVAPSATAEPTASATPPAPPTTPAPGKVTPSVSSDGVSRTVAYGTPLTQTFTVTAGGVPWAGRPARICTTEKGATFFHCRSTRTSATGTVVVQRTVTAPFRLKLLVSATKTSEAAASETYTYSVRAVARMAKKGRTLTALLGGAAGQRVEVQRLDAGTWTTVASYRATSRYTVRKPVTGAEYRVVVPDTALMAGVTSNSVVM